MGEIGYRNRSEATVPTLVYDEEYFQRFEPVTAGDALKRVPSVTFLSDVIESDGARLRGLDPGYTQILINGERVPGTQADRSFFLDRIPAELVQQVEIVRSSSARRTGDAVAGTLNIKLRDAYSLDGGYFRAGGIRFDDGNLVPNMGLYYGGALAGGRLLIGGNIQGRYNPKLKYSLRYNDSPENGASLSDPDNLANREDQTDTRDGTDYAVNGSWGIKNDATEFELSGNYVRTQRTEDERSFVYNRATGTPGPVAWPITPTTVGLLADNNKFTDILQESYSIAAKLSHEWSLGKTKLRASYAKFSDDQTQSENEIEYDRATPRFTADLNTQRIVDREWSVNLEHAFPLAEGIDLAAGGFIQNKDRDSDIRTIRARRNLTNALRTRDQFTTSPTEFVLPFGAAPIGSVAGGVNSIREERRDVYGLIEGKSGALSFEAGLRWENTKVRINDLTIGAQAGTDYDVLLPSASVKYDIGRGRITASVARTVKRPGLNYLSPATLEGELGDNDLRGNPRLRPETAWGGDLGYEHHIGRTGVIGVNAFYRKISNLIELANTGLPGDADEGPGGDRAWIYQPRNGGAGEVYGIEFDLSASLGFVGLPDTGLFGNLSLIDSKITDELGERRFNGQSKYVYNFGFIQNLRKLGGAFGVTYRKQGPAFDRVVAEEVTTSYGADLEIFVEKRIGDRATIRFVGSNLLNGAKRETFNKFNTIDQQIGRDFHEYELESETAGPVFQLTGRFSF